MFSFWPETSVHTHLSVIVPNNGTTSSTKMHRYGIPWQIWPHKKIGSKTLTTAIKLRVILLREGQQLFWSQSLWNANNKNGFQSYLNVCDFSV